jgi:hypothetical protein
MTGPTAALEGLRSTPPNSGSPRTLIGGRVGTFSEEAVEDAANVPLPTGLSAPRSLEREPLDPESLRAKIRQHLLSQGFMIRNDRILAPVTEDKERIRKLHAEAVATGRRSAAPILQPLETRFLSRLASGSEVSPSRIIPALVPIIDRRSFLAKLWRWCALHWSIPVSTGYGRRMRFLVVDISNGDKVIGLIGLADPVFALACREQWVGWSRDERRSRLTCMMDAYVLGAVPPYNRLLAGKLVALLATSTEVRLAFAEKYAHQRTLIADRDPDAQLAAITTSSALGRSSIYNRLTGPDRIKAFIPVGYTSGSGDFHFSGEIYEYLASFAMHVTPEGQTHRHNRWTGQSFRNRREVVQRSLDALGFDSRQLRVHGIRRQVFIAPMMENAVGFLRGVANQPSWRTYSVDDLSEWWRKRWAIGRAARDSSWRDFEPGSWRLWSS